MNSKLMGIQKQLNSCLKKVIMKWMT